jgi:hypothetical protein
MALASRLGRESMTLFLVLWQYGQRMGRQFSVFGFQFSVKTKRIWNRGNRSASILNMYLILYQVFRKGLTIFPEIRLKTEGDPAGRP